MPIRRQSAAFFCAVVFNCGMSILCKHVLERKKNKNKKKSSVCLVLVFSLFVVAVVSSLNQRKDANIWLSDESAQNKKSVSPRMSCSVMQSIHCDAFMSGNDDHARIRWPKLSDAVVSRESYHIHVTQLKLCHYLWKVTLELFVYGGQKVGCFVKGNADPFHVLRLKPWDVLCEVTLTSFM